MYKYIFFLILWLIVLNYECFFFFIIRLPAWGGRQISKVLGLTWEMRGQENIVQDSGCVVLINHQSCLDLLGKYIFCKL